jgi:hypothetical protein
VCACTQASAIAHEVTIKGTKAFYDPRPALFSTKILGNRKRSHAYDFKSWNTPGPRITPVILATKEADIRRIVVQSQARQIVSKTLSLKTLSQNIGLVEWLKVKALS